MAHTSEKEQYIIASFFEGSVFITISQYVMYHLKRGHIMKSALFEIIVKNWSDDQPTNCEIRDSFGFF